MYTYINVNYVRLSVLNLANSNHMTVCAICSKCKLYKRSLFIKCYYVLFYLM